MQTAAALFQELCYDNKDQLRSDTALLCQDGFSQLKKMLTDILLRKTAQE